MQKQKRIPHTREGGLATIKLILVGGIIVWAIWKMGLLSAFGGEPAYSVDCPSSVDGIEGQLNVSYALVDDAGRVVSLECPFHAENWYAIVWPPADGDRNNLADYVVYKNGRAVSAAKAMVNGELTVFSTDGRSYTAAMCGDLWYPEDTHIVKWGRTSWQQQCLNGYVADHYH